MEKKKVFMILMSLMILIGLIIPVVLFTNRNTSDDIDYITFKQMEDRYKKGLVKVGDIYHINDTLSSIWYNATAGYTYMSFESNDDSRAPYSEYDGGYQKDISDDFKVGDVINAKIKFVNDPSRTPSLVGHFEWIKHGD